MNTDRQLGLGMETARVADFKGVSHFVANFRLKGYVSRQWLYTTTLPLEIFTKETL